MSVRPMTVEDAGAVTEIYAHHVLHGTGTFDEVPPSEGEMAARIAGRAERGFPAYVVADGDRITGFAYVGPYKDRSAYRYTVEDSIYMAEGAQRRGTGLSLLSHLLDATKSAGFRNVMAVIGDSGNTGSIALHRRAGFAYVGTATGLGHKFGRDLDVVYMQLTF